MSIDTSECGDRPTRMIGVISLKACVSGLPDDLHIICDVVSSYVISQHYFSWPGRLDGGRLRLAGCSHISIDQSNAVIFDANNRRQFIERGSVSVMQSFFFLCIQAKCYDHMNTVAPHFVYGPRNSKTN